MTWSVYVEYKESGNEYLGDVPSHWTVSKFSRHISINGGQVDPRIDPYRTMPLIAPNHIESGTGKLSALESAEGQGADSGKYLVRKGQLIYSKIRPNLAKAVTAPADCLCSADMYGLSPDPSVLDSDFALRVLLSRPFTDYVIDSSMRVAMPKVNHESLGAAPLWFPPLGEQRKIVGFLDRETAKIDALISKQEQLIATLREDRAATITQAVTKGLDPNVEMKDSGIGWIGGIPTHWEAVRLRHRAAMKTGHTPSRSVEEYWENTTIPWFTLADVWQLRGGRQVYLGETASLISELGLQNSAAELLPAGTVVLSRTASVGFSGIMPTAMATSQDFWNWVCGPELEATYLVYLFRAMRPYFDSLMMGSTHQTIYQADAASIKIPLPPVEEQREIVSVLGSKIQRMDALIDKSTEMIDTLREYRSALITDAVTGKIDIRGVA